MKVFISRVSTEEQSELRQIQNIEHFDKVVIDKCDGDIHLWDRPNIVKNKIKKLVDNGTIKHIEVHSIDRLGRDTLSVLSVWKNWESISTQPIEILSQFFQYGRN